MGKDVLGLEEVDRTQSAVVGGKGARLGELSQIDGIHVPAGFCITADAFRRIVADAPSIDERLDRLSRLASLRSSSRSGSGSGRIAARLGTSRNARQART